MQGDGLGAHPGNHEALWIKVIRSAEADLGVETVQKWLLPVSIQMLQGDLIVLAAPSAFIADWVERNYGLQLLRAFQSNGAQVRRISVTVSQRDADIAVPQPIPEPHDIAELPSGLQSAPLDPRFTFESFVVGKPNELAHAAARRVADTCDATFNPVFLYGGVGLGKTHLMHAIAHRIGATRPSCKVLYLSAEQFMYRFVQALRFRDTITFKQQFRSIDVLMIDDVQFIAGKDSTQEEFFHTFNALIDQKKQIVISADRSPDQIDGLQNRITSRLQWDWWSIFIRRTMNCVWASCSRRPSGSWLTIRRYLSINACSSSSLTGSSRMFGCSKAH